MEYKMLERYIKIEGNLVYDTKTNRIMRNPLIIVDAESYLIIDIVDDFPLHFFTDAESLSSYRFVRFTINDGEMDLILNNLNAYDFFMRTKDFDSVQHYIKKALEIE